MKSLYISSNEQQTDAVNITKNKVTVINCSSNIASKILNKNYSCLKK